VSDPQDPTQNPPGWTDPYSDPVDAGVVPPVLPGQPPTSPNGQPPGSPLLTGLIIGLLLVALSVAVFQLFGAEDDGTAAGTTTTSTAAGESTTSTAAGESTTTSSSTTLPATDPYPPVEPPIPAEDMKMMTDGLRINDNDIKDIVFGQEADLAVGRLVASFGEATQDTGWQTSTGQYGVCAGDLERIVIFDTFAAIVTKSGGQEIFNGYRNDLTTGELGTGPASIETLSGLVIGDTVATMQGIYAGQRVVFGTDPKLGPIYEVNSAASGSQLLWGPDEGEDDSDRVIGIYAPDVCSR
jgi:hypothetical protein